MIQLDLDLVDTDRVVRLRRRLASRAKWQERLTAGILRKARAIQYRGAPQETSILCPINGGGYYCQWVAGHYGGCVLGRPFGQRSRKEYK